MTTDIFNNTILCGNCNTKMDKVQFMKNGFILRALDCPKCHSKMVHPMDEQEYNDFLDLKKKEFNVKMRFVGNSYTVSIPKEIVNFMKEQERMLDDMVRLCFNNSHSLSLNFNTKMENSENVKSRVIQAKEFRVVRNNEPVLHVKQLYDSANPRNNKMQVFKNDESVKEVRK
ncbi:hypothetical protein J4218_06745 [Candidatus Pacearchaeota archaeon]|nr:hypothetical protein [Candidatus Pacearchaeota archaeon]